MRKHKPAVVVTAKARTKQSISPQALLAEVTPASHQEDHLFDYQDGDPPGACRRQMQQVAVHQKEDCGGPKGQVEPGLLPPGEDGRGRGRRSVSTRCRQTRDALCQHHQGRYYCQSAAKVSIFGKASHLLT